MSTEPCTPVLETITHDFDNGEKVSCPGQFDCYICGTQSLIRRGAADLVGQLLTIVDATVQAERSNKAMKDLIKQTTYHNLDTISTDATWILKNAMKKLTEATKA
jgi:hypothetical protein